MGLFSSYSFWLFDLGGFSQEAWWQMSLMSEVELEVRRQRKHLNQANSS